MLLQKARPSRRGRAVEAVGTGGLAFAPGRRARLSAALRSAALDAALAAGGDPTASEQLAARARALSARRTRTALAEGFERLLAYAGGAPGARRLSLRREAVLANATALRELAALLRGPAPLYVRGIALARGLLADGAGPAYRGDAGALARRLAEAREQMLGGSPAAA